VANGVVFDEFQFLGVVSGSKTAALSFSSANKFIFNQGTVITAEVKCEVGGDDTQI